MSDLRNATHATRRLGIVGVPVPGRRARRRRSLPMTTDLCPRCRAATAAHTALDLLAESANFDAVTVAIDTVLAAVSLLRPDEP